MTDQDIQDRAGKLDRALYQEQAQRLEDLIFALTEIKILPTPRDLSDTALNIIKRAAEGVIVMGSIQFLILAYQSSPRVIEMVVEDVLKPMLVDVRKRADGT